MNAIMAIHIAAGIAALPLGTLALAVRKGGWLHAKAGTLFFASMLVLGLTAAVLEPFRQPEPGSPVGGLIVCYLVATGWMTARRRDGRTGRFERWTCAIVLSVAALALASGIAASLSPTGEFAGQGAGRHFFGAILLALFGALDLNVILKDKMTGQQRILRHVWRMCVAFFVATGSFFIGQQDVMPAVVSGSPWLFALGLAPLAIMIFWLVRVRYGRALAKIERRLRPLAADGPV